MDTYGDFTLPDEPKPIAPPAPPAPIPVEPSAVALPPAYNGDSIPVEGRALLDTIAGTEAHSYNVVYGGQTFASYADHPRIAVPIASGPNEGKTSSAAGRYQFLGSTWDAQKAKLGLKDFSPRNQDLAAWDLAQTTYKAETGRELLSDLKAGRHEDVGRALSKQWTSLPGGIEQGTSSDSFRSRFAQAMQQGPSVAPVTPEPLFGDADLMHGYQAAGAPKDYKFTDALSAAARYETALGLIYGSVATPRFTPDAFTWTPQLQSEKLGDLDAETQEHIRSTAVSLDHVDFLRDEALKRMEGEKAIAAQGFVGGAAAVMGAGLVDLPSWIVGGYAGAALRGARSAGMAMRIARTAGEFAAADLPLEAAKAALDYKYDAGDVVRGLATAALFGGGFAGLGEVGGAYASRFRTLQADPDNVHVGSGTFSTEAQTAEEASTASAAGQGLSAEVAAAIPPAIPNTRMDAFARKLGAWADYSVGGRLYNSKNDVIAELAPKLTTVATQDITQEGGRAVEGALDFVRRAEANNSAKVSTALDKWYKPWAKEQGFNAWETATKQDQFFSLAADVHVDPNINPRDVDPNVMGFVNDMRQLFADELKMGKAYGVERMATLEENPHYLPRYFDRVQWRTQRAEHGLEGIEDVVAQAIKAGDPEIAQRVGSRIVARAAERDAQAGAKDFRPLVSQDARAIRDAEIVQAVAQARDANEAITTIAKGVQDEIAAQINEEAAHKVAQRRLGSPQEGVDGLPATSDAAISFDSVQASVSQEVAYWQNVEQELRAEAAKLARVQKDAKARLLKEADEIKAFHEKLLATAEDAWAEAESHYAFQAQKMAQAEARLERDARLSSLNKKTQKTIKDERASINEQRDTRVAGSKERAQEAIRDRMATIHRRFFEEAFAKHMAKFEDKFVRRVARKYVQTVDNSIEGMRSDVDRALSTRDTELLRDALREQGIPIDEATADAIADLLAPRAQRGPSNLRKRTVLDEHSAFSPSGGGKAFSLRDLMETDYEKIIGRYTRGMAPHYIMAQHGFQTESAARKYVADSITQFKGINGYTDRNAWIDNKRANYLLDVIYGRDPQKHVDPKVRAWSTILSNFAMARIGGAFGMSAAYDASELVLRHGFEAFQRGVPSWKQLADTVKQGGHKADPIVRDLQIFAGVGVKGQQAEIVPKFRGLESELADTVTGTRLTKIMKTSKGVANAVGHASGLNVATDTLQFAAARMYLQTVADVARGTRKVPPRLLADMGLSKENLAKWWGVLQHAKFDKDGIIEDLRADYLKSVDLRAFDELMGATRREAFRTILEPHPGLLPVWAGTSPVGKFFFQLKTFSTAANAVHTIGNWRLGPAYVAKSVVGGAAWAFAVYSLWAHVKSLGRGEKERKEYLDKAFAPDKLAFNVWSRMGVAGQTPELIGSGLAAGRFLGVVPPDEGNFYGQAARASGLVQGGFNSIPVVNMIEAVLDSAKSGLEAVKEGRSLTRGEARKMLSLIPLQNALGISHAINAMTTNLPQKKEDTR